MSSATPTAPDSLPAFVPQIRLYQDWLAAERGLSFDSYDALWRWSTTELDAFWQSIWDYFDLQSPTPHTAVLEKNVMPGANWFPGAQVNYAQQVLRHAVPAHAAGFAPVISRNEKGRAVELSWPELQRQVASLALHLQAQGVKPGDRVAAYLPNIPETMVAFLATVSIGGVWSVCAPDMGTNAVLDRFRQIEPKVLIACDGVTYGGRDFDRLAVVGELRAALPSVQHLILHTNLAETVAQAEQALAAAAPCASFAAVTALLGAAQAELIAQQVQQQGVVGHGQFVDLVVDRQGQQLLAHAGLLLVDATPAGARPGEAVERPSVRAIGLLRYRNTELSLIQFNICFGLHSVPGRTPTAQGTAGELGAGRDRRQRPATCNSITRATRLRPIERRQVQQPLVSLPAPPKPD